MYSASWQVFDINGPCLWRIFWGSIHSNQASYPDQCRQASDPRSISVSVMPNEAIVSPFLLRLRLPWKESEARTWLNHLAEVARHALEILASSTARPYPFAAQRVVRIRSLAVRASLECISRSCSTCSDWPEARKAVGISAGTRELGPVNPFFLISPNRSSWHLKLRDMIGVTV